MAKRRLSNWLLTGGAVLAAWAIYKALTTDRNMPIGPAIDAPRDEFHGSHSSLLSYYAKTDAPGRPLVLLHGIGMAASAYDVRPIFDAYKRERPVYALDLPGYGFSERSNREYSVELYVAAITDFLNDIVDQAADVVALSLSSEFAAIAAKKSPGLFRSLTLVSPTGFSPDNGQSNNNAPIGFLSNPLSGQVAYDMMVAKASLTASLSLNFSEKPDEGLLDYQYRSSHQPGARYAPIRFVCGDLFSPNIVDSTYKKLTVPTMVIYDTDPDSSFERLPEVLEANTKWRARRIVNTKGYPHFERPDMTLDALNSFFEDID